MYITVVKGILTGRIGSDSTNRATDKVHVVARSGNETVCGIKLKNSKSLGFPEIAESKEVNCKRCKSSYYGDLAIEI